MLQLVEKEMYMSEKEQEGQAVQGHLIDLHVPDTTYNQATEAETIVREVREKYLCSVALPEIGSDWTDEEELEWDALFAKPHVQAAIHRLAEEAKQQFMHGETEEGGFAVE